MKHAATTTLLTFAMFGLVTVATAQMSPGTTAPSSDASVQADSRGDDVAALPRETVRRATILGLPPAAAIIVGGALLLIVVLSIMALAHRVNDRHVNPHRRF